MLPPDAPSDERLFGSVDPDDSNVRVSLFSRFTKTGFIGASSAGIALRTCGASALGTLLTGISTGDPTAWRECATSVWRAFVPVTEASIMSMPPSCDEASDVAKRERAAVEPFQQEHAAHPHRCFQKRPNQSDPKTLRAWHPAFRGEWQQFRGRHGLLPSVPEGISVQLG